MAGMRWSQGTFGIRFNVFRGGRGLSFSLDTRASSSKEGRPLLGLVNYIHLNPVRPGIGNHCGVARA